jgi:hypothetical protein
MSPESFLVLLVGLFVLWLAARGRLASIVHAMESGGTRAPSRGTPPDSGGATFGPGFGTPPPGTSGWDTPTGTAPSGFPSPGLFGIQPTGEVLGENLPGVAAGDQSALSAAGGGQFAHDYDYMLPVGTPVYAPPGQYHVEQTPSPEGRAIALRAMTNGVDAPSDPTILLYHLTADPLATQTGATIEGRPYLGLSDYPQGADELGPHTPANGHVAVIVDQAGDAWLQSLMGMGQQGFGPTGSA